MRLSNSITERYHEQMADSQPMGNRHVSYDHSVEPRDMSRTVTARLSPPGGKTLVRSLAALLVGLLATYALGTVASGTIPALHTAGVVAVHLAVVVGFLFPVAVLGQAAVSWSRTDESQPRGIESGIALITVSSLIVGLWQATNPVADVLLGIAAGGSLLLAGLVIRSSL